MNYKAGDRVKIKSLGWYNKNKDQEGNVSCGEQTFVDVMAKFCGKELTITFCSNSGYFMKEDGGTFLWTDKMIERYADIRKERDRCLTDLQYWFDHYCVLPDGYNPINVLEKKTNKDMNENNTKVDMGEVSDGYHTFNELYEYRMLYNAALFNEFAKQGLYDVHKSRKHSDGEHPFGDSNWFIVMAELPTGQISNHYEMKDWDKFQIPEKPLANKWDEHSPKDVADRLTSFTTPKKEYPKTYEECCKVMNYCYNPVATKTTHKEELIRRFQFLLLYRDAYWKIAGDEMGLGKPWEPDGNPVYAITRNDGCVVEMETGGNDEVFEFPTKEMRNAFKENFDKDLEFCKEFL